MTYRQVKHDYLLSVLAKIPKVKKQRRITITIKKLLKQF